MTRLRARVRDLVESERYQAWLVELPDPVLIQVVAPLEMLAFQYYLDPPRERHLVRAARVACEAFGHAPQDCPADLVDAVRALASAVAR